MENIVNQTINLINDSYSKRIGTFASPEAVKYTDEAVRLAIFDILGENKLTYRGWRNHKNELFTIIEEVLDTNLPLAWEDSPFYRQFVESKNGKLSEKNEFVVNDASVLVATTFAGNHWDTDRKKISGRKTFSLDTEWIYIHVYDDFERFLKGLITVADLINAMQSAMQRAIDERIYTAFNGAGTYLPAAFQVTGTYDRGKMLELIQRVQTASQKNVILAGTKTALANIANGMNSAWISNAQKEEMATKGAVLELTGLGVSAVEIPQTFIRGTYNFKVDDTNIFVLPDNEKFIKLYYEGDTRARDLSEIQTHDQTIDSQVQTKIGVGLAFSSVFGKYAM